MSWQRVAELTAKVRSSSFTTNREITTRAHVAKKHASQVIELLAQSETAEAIITREVLESVVAGFRAYERGQERGSCPAPASLTGPWPRVHGIAAKHCDALASEPSIPRRKQLACKLATLARDTLAHVDTVEATAAHALLTVVYDGLQGAP